MIFKPKSGLFAMMTVDEARNALRLRRIEAWLPVSNADTLAGAFRGYRENAYEIAARAKTFG